MSGRPSPAFPSAPRSGRPPLTAIGAATVWALSSASLAVGLLTAPSSGPNAPTLANFVTIGLAVLLPVTVGAILVIRLPRNLIGWLLVLSGLSLAVNLGASGLAGVIDVGA